ncbi:O-antigen translocase [Arcticibacter pallidicorallinus]|uniref:O-antigen translocase n=1 Tax=Arcticibacter pallidicorallinus TaxID=1259464 RepID=UPI002481D8E7|nr:O-antigen translocase [Arcticibacter pallidicorallinus]
MFSSTALSTFVRMLTGFVSVKVIAIMVGPSGLATLGQLNNFATIMLMLASGGINNGVTKFISEFNNVDEEKVRKYTGVAIQIVLVCSLMAGIFLIAFNSVLSRELLHDEAYAFIFVVFGCTILFYGLNTTLLSVVNGFKDFKKFVTISISDSILGLGFSITLVVIWGIKGALISAVTYQSVMLLVTVFLIRNDNRVNFKMLRVRFDRSIAKKYLRYSLMTLVTAATIPVSQMILREHAITQISGAQAGLWEGMNRLSNMYLMIITTSFSVYYLPRLSEISDVTILRREIINAYKILVPLLSFGLVATFILRTFIIDLVFSQEFNPMKDLFLYQLIGDFFKIISWILACLMLAKTMTKTYVVTEMIFSLLFVVLGLGLLRMGGIVGLTQAYMINYIIYFFTMLFIFRKFLFT